MMRLGRGMMMMRRHGRTILAAMTLAGAAAGALAITALVALNR